MIATLQRREQEERQASGPAQDYDHEMRAIQIEAFGGPEVLQLMDVPEPRPGDGQVLIDVAAAGVNYADVMGIDAMVDRRSCWPGVLGQDEPAQ